VVSNFLDVTSKIYVLADGPLVLEDQDNELRAVVFFQGLIKESSLQGAKYVANLSQSKKLIQGLIYKQNLELVKELISHYKVLKVEKIDKLQDIVYKLERITGSSLDYYEIEGIA